MSRDFKDSLERASERVSKWPDSRRGAFEQRMGMKLPPVEKKKATVKEMFFFANGNYCAFNDAGDQVPEEQGSAWMKVLQEKLDRGVIDENTAVKMEGWGNKTVRELIDSGRLKRGKV